MVDGNVDGNRTARRQTAAAGRALRECVRPAAGAADSPAIFKQGHACSFGPCNGAGKEFSHHRARNHLWPLQHQKFSPITERRLR